MNALKIKKGPIILPLLLLAALLAGYTAMNFRGISAADSLSLGQQYLNEMDYGGAIAAFTKAIELDPTSREAHLGLARAYVGSENDELAQELLEEMAGSMVYEAKRMTSAIAKMADKGDDLVDGIDTIVDGVFDSADELDSILVITSDTMVDAAGLLGSLRSALDVADSMLDACDRDLNEGAHRTLEGLTGTLRQLTKSLNKSQDLKANKDIIADIVRDEWSRLDEDFNLLDIDTKAEKVSFTSLRNEEPRSLQIIMRTKEISIDEDAVEAAAQAEEGAAPDTVLGRIAAVFTAIWNFILGLFQ